MGQLADHYLLSWIVFSPLAAAAFLLATGLVASILIGTKGLPGVLWRALGLSSSILTFLGATWLWVCFDPEQTGYQLVERVPWLPAYGVNYFIGLDGVGLLAVLLTAFLVPIAMLACWKDVASHERSFVVLMLGAETAALGVIVSINMLQFLLFWELLLIPLYYIVGIWGGGDRLRASLRFLLSASVGSASLLVAVLILYQLNFEQGGQFNLDLVTLPGEFGLSLLGTDIAGWQLGGKWWTTQAFLFAAVAFAFASVVPVIPLHTWVPESSSEGPVAGAVLLAAVVPTLGILGFMRFVLPLFPDVASSAPVMSWALGIGIVGLLYASLVARVQTDLRRLVAYASVAQLGLVFAGTFTANTHGLTGGVVMLISHALTASGLLILVGFLYERRRTAEIEHFGGVAKPMPIYAATFGALLMASLGMPALSGFVGQVLILVGAFAARPWLALGGVLGIVLLGAGLISMYQRVMLGPVSNPENRGLIDLDWRERAIAVAILVPIVWIGVYPNPVLRRIEPSVMEWLRIMDERSASLNHSDVAKDRESTLDGEGDTGINGDEDAPSDETGEEEELRVPIPSKGSGTVL